MVFLFNQPGNYKFYLDDVALGPAPRPQKPEEPVPTQVEPSALRNSYHSMWVWHAKDLFGRGRAMRFFRFCSRMQIKEIYLSAAFSLSSDGAIPASVQNPEGYRKFLAAAHQRRLRVEALSGSPEWAAAEYHPRALAAMESILDFNAASPPGARFDGVHFDVEPYLLVGFFEPGYRIQILKEYLEMLSQCAAIARRARIEFSCDIPWWFYPATPLTRKQFSVAFNGTEKTVGQHVTDLLDSVTIMDYRNEADGAGGIITVGGCALDYAAQTHKKVVVGLETSQELKTPVDFILAIPARRAIYKLRKARLLGRRSFERCPMHSLTGRKVVFLGLGAPRSSGPAPRESIETALAHLDRLLRGKPAENLAKKSLLQEALTAVAGNPEWTGLEVVTIARPRSHRMLPAFRALHRTAPAVTFHGWGRKVFIEESSSATEWLSQYPSFDGLAIHDYRSFRALMSEP